MKYKMFEDKENCPPPGAYRKELILEVPVNSEKTEAFCRRQDEFHYRKTSWEILNFVNKELPDKFPVTETTKKLYGELIKNSYDSYAIKGLKLSSSLILKAVVKINADKKVIKIKDNGNGFPRREKNEPFCRVVFNKNPLEYQNKGIEKGFLGGQRKGLTLFENHLKKLDGHMLLKNRKQGGAAIHMLFSNEDFNQKQEGEPDRLNLNRKRKFGF